MHVHLLRKTESEALEVLRSNLDDKLQLTVGEVEEGHSGTTVLVAGRPSREELAAFPDLKTLIIPWIGIPPETLKLFRLFHLLSIHNLHHYSDPTS